MNAHYRGHVPRPGQPPAAFVCPVCLARSWHPEDGRQGYCGVCHDFTGHLVIDGEVLDDDELRHLRVADRPETNN